MNRPGKDKRVDTLSRPPVIFCVTVNRVLRTDEVAKLLRVTPQTVSRLAKRGKIPAFKMGSDWRNREQIDEFMKGEKSRDD